jgi:diguanylate cyclase (GGDEF)-like protein
MVTELAFVIAIVSMNLLLGTLCLAIARGERESPALRFWGLGLLVYTLGLVTNMSSVTFPSPVLPVLGYSLIVLAALLSVKGVLCHTQYQINNSWIAATLIPVVGLLAYNHFGPVHHPIIDFVTPTALAILVFLIGSLLFLTDLPKDAKKAARFAAFAMLFGTMIWSIRLLVIAGLFGTLQEEETKFIFHLISVGHLVVTVASTFGLFSIEVRKMESALSRVAFVDVLTNLPNRRAMQERFHQEMARANRHQQSFALLVIDIDHFKRINDANGHPVGDAVLQHVASVLSKVKRAEDVLGRIGGDEFVLLLDDPAVKNAMAAAERIRKKVEDEVLLFHGRRVPATVSIGLAAYPVDGKDWNSIFATADHRLYQSKRSGRNRVTGFALHPS